MAWCHQATRCYLNQYWRTSLLLSGVTRPQWVKTDGKHWRYLESKESRSKQHAMDTERVRQVSSRLFHICAQNCNNQSTRTEPCLHHNKIPYHWCTLSINSSTLCTTYMSVNCVRIGSENGLLPVGCQAITWTNAGLLSIELLGTHFSEI